MHRSIYLASRWENKDKLQNIRRMLINFGHTVTSTWLDETSNTTRQENAIRDLCDVVRATTLILWPDDKPGDKTQGKMVEYGYALALHKEILVIEPHTSACIFLDLPQIWKFKSWEDAVLFLRGEDA